MQSEEVVEDRPEVPVDRVKIMVSEAQVSSEHSAVIERVVERQKEYGKAELRLFALDRALVSRDMLEYKPDETGRGTHQRTTEEFADVVTTLADRYLTWLTTP